MPTPLEDFSPARRYAGIACCGGVLLLLGALGVLVAFRQRAVHLEEVRGPGAGKQFINVWRVILEDVWLQIEPFLLVAGIVALLVGILVMARQRTGKKQ